MMTFSVPPGYRRSKLAVRPKLDPFVGIIERILDEDSRRPAKQRPTLKRIFERLRDEHGFAGGSTMLKDYVSGWHQRSQEMFIPLEHPAGHAQADFGESLGIIGGVERKIHFLCMDLPHSDACFVVAYPAETTEAFCDGHVQAFVFFGGVAAVDLHDTTSGPRLPASWVTANGFAPWCSPSCSRTTYLRTGSAGLARVTTRARSRGWWLCATELPGADHGVREL